VRKNPIINKKPKDTGEITDPEVIKRVKEGVAANQKRDREIEEWKRQQKENEVMTPEQITKLAQEIGQSVAKELVEQQYRNSPQGQAQAAAEQLAKSVEDQYKLDPTAELYQKIDLVNNGEYTASDLMFVAFSKGNEGLAEVEAELRSKRNLERANREKAERLRKQASEIDGR